MGIHRRIARRYEKLFRSYSFRAWRFLETTDTFHVVEYVGRVGLKLKTAFKNLHTKCSSPNDISFSVLIMVDKTDLTVFTDE